MATSAHNTGWYNVQGTLTAWMYEGLVAYKPPMVTTVSMVFTAPEIPLLAPVWSVYFLGTVPTSVAYQGGYVGGSTYGERKAGIMEVSCWVTRENVSWRAQLAQMADAVYRTVFALKANGSGLVIKDFYTNAAAPAATSFRVIVEGAEDRTPPVDPNPAIERRRIIIEFNWVERA